MNILSGFIGDKKFYKRVLVLLIPIIIQQFISSFVSLLDNVMVGSLGTEAISAASIANTAIGLRHPRNGNRATILATEDTIAIMINGRLKKQITLAELRAQAPVTAYSGT